MSSETRKHTARLLTTALVAATLIAALTGCGGATRAGDAPERWRFAIEETAGSVQHAYATRFKELIEEKSGGDIEVTVYPYGTLGTSDHVTELLAMGTVQFAMASPGHLGKIIPEVQVFLLHFILTDDEETNNKILSDPELKAHFDELYAEKGFQLLSIFSEGWMVWTTQDAVREPADFRGMKIRVMTTPLLLEAYRAYGASPTPLPYGEVYSGLQLNMIDAQVNPIFAIEEMSFYEVVDYMILANHAPFITTAVANREFLDNLSEERRTMVLETIDELREYILDVQREFNAERLETIKENKPSIQIIESLTEDQRQAFREASMQVRERYVDMVGPKGEETLALLDKLVQRYGS